MPAKPALGADRILPRAAAPWGRGGSGRGVGTLVTRRGAATNPDWRTVSLVVLLTGEVGQSLGGHFGYGAGLLQQPKMRLGRSR
jgi:hypothetical protein